MSVKGYDSLAYLIFKNIAKYRISERWTVDRFSDKLCVASKVVSVRNSNSL
jgi:hypothetical protein